MLAFKDGAAVKLVSRTGIDHTRRFQAIVAAIRAMSAPTLILDGELAVFDQKPVSRFEWLRHHASQTLRLHRSSWPSTACIIDGWLPLAAEERPGRHPRASIHD